MAKNKKDKKKEEQGELLGGTPESLKVEEKPKKKKFWQMTDKEKEWLKSRRVGGGLKRPKKKDEKEKGVAKAVETPGKTDKSAKDILNIIRPKGLTKAEQRAVDTGAVQLGQPESKAITKKDKDKVYKAPEGGGRIKIKGKWIEYTKQDLAGIVKEAKAKGKLVSGKDVVGERVVDGKKIPITSYDVSESKRRVRAGLPGREAAVRERQADIRVKEGMEFNEATGEYQPVGGQANRRERFAEAQRRVNSMTGRNRAVAQKRLNALSKKWDKEDAAGAKPKKAPKTKEILRADRTIGLYQWDDPTGGYVDTGLNVPGKGKKAGGTAREKIVAKFAVDFAGDPEGAQEALAFYDANVGGGLPGPTGVPRAPGLPAATAQAGGIPEGWVPISKTPEGRLIYLKPDGTKAVL